MSRILIMRYWWIWLSLAAFLFAWCDQSLWIDECCMVMSAAQSSFADVWTKVTDIGGSDTQMAFYLYFLHIWIRLTGADSEMLLRLYNVVWVLLAGWFLRKEPKVLFLLVISPFFLYYANELRPYIMQIAASCGISMFLYKRSMGEEQSYTKGFGFLFLLCVTSLTSVVWAIGFLVAWIILEGKEFWSKKLIKSVVCWILPFAALGAYYLYTLLLGARAAFIESDWLVNVGASMYELFGLAGLGPARSELRLCSSLSDILWNPELLLPALCGIFIGVLVIAGCWEWRKCSSRGVLLSLGALFALPVCIFIYASEMMDFRFSGRHFAPLLPIICTALSMGVGRFGEKTCMRILSASVILIWCVSNWFIRFDDTYAREDYRTAIEYCQARERQGEKIMLLCNGAGKQYYGWSDSVSPDEWAECQVVVVSRPSDFADVIKLVELSGNYEKRRLCPAFWVYVAKTLKPGISNSNI